MVELPLRAHPPTLVRQLRPLPGLVAQVIFYRHYCVRNSDCGRHPFNLLPRWLVPRSLDASEGAEEVRCPIRVVCYP